MQREIKFRAWDKKQKSFINGFNMIGFSTGQGAPKRKLQRFDTYWDEEEVVIMQYTGLKDKNGKEIYEGDICIVSLSYFKIKDEKATVIFHNGAFQFQYGCEKFFSKPHDAWDKVEVIGNIHDNPELLGKIN